MAYSFVLVSLCVGLCLLVGGVRGFRPAVRPLARARVIPLSTEAGSKGEGGGIPRKSPLADVAEACAPLPVLPTAPRTREAVLVELMASSLSSATGFFLADVVCQLYTRKFSFLRFLRFGLLGGLTYGAVAFCARSVLSDVIPERSTTPTVMRVMLDQVVGGPLFVGSLLLVMGKFNVDLWQRTVRIGWGLWAAAHLVNFTVLPKKSRLAFFNIVQVSYNVILRLMTFHV